MNQEILPPELEPGHGPDRTPEIGLDPDNLPPALTFIPVPRRGRPNAGINALRQRTFIAHLAGNGSVEMSAMAVGISDSAFYQLRKAEGAESFAAAWEVAIDMGARRVLDTLMDHAIHGVPEKLIKDGKVILERRKFNTRAMMWIVQQRFPEQFGGSLNILGRPASSMPDSLKKLKKEWRAEWEKEWNEKHKGMATEEETNAALVKRLQALHRRKWHEAFVPWMDDAEKRAACEVLYGEQDWALIRERAERLGVEGKGYTGILPRRGAGGE